MTTIDDIERIIGPQKCPLCGAPLTLRGLVRAEEGEHYVLLARGHDERARLECNVPCDEDGNADLVNHGPWRAPWGAR
jgi:hypothetical protein